MQGKNGNGMHGTEIVGIGMMGFELDGVGVGVVVRVRVRDGVEVGVRVGDRVGDRVGAAGDVVGGAPVVALPVTGVVCAGPAPGVRLAPGRFGAPGLDVGLLDGTRTGKVVPIRTGSGFDEPLPLGVLDAECEELDAAWAERVV